MQVGCCVVGLLRGHADAGSLVARSTAKRLDLVALFLILAIGASIAVTFPSQSTRLQAADQSTLTNATIAAISPCDGDPTDCLLLDVVPSVGRDSGQVFRIPEVTTESSFLVGDKIVLRSNEGSDSGFRYSYEDHQRLPLLAIVSAALGVCLVLVGRLSGIRVMLALAAVGALLWFYTLPALADGANSPVTALVSACAAAVTLTFVKDGIGAHHIVGAISSVVAVTASVGLGWLTLLLAGLPNDLPLTGIAIGAVGAVVALSSGQASAVFNQRAANPHLTARQLAVSGLQANRPRLGTTLATLTLAYLGAGTSALVIFASANQSALQSLNSAEVAAIAIAVLVATAGLIVVVPLAASLAAAVATGPSEIDTALLSDERPPVRRAAPAPSPARRRRESVGSGPKAKPDEPSLWERMRQGLDD